MKVNPVERVHLNNINSQRSIRQNNMNFNKADAKNTAIENYLGEIARRSIRLKSILDKSPVEVLKLYYKALQKVLTDIN